MTRDTWAIEASRHQSNQDCAVRIGVVMERCAKPRHPGGAAQSELELITEGIQAPSFPR